MKLSIDFDYILKRVVVLVLAFVIISSLKSCNVFALSCESGTWDIGYQRVGSTQYDTATTINRSLPVGVTKLRYYYSVSTMRNTPFSFSTEVGVRLFGYGPNSSAPELSVYYNGDITKYCIISVNKSNYPYGNDDLIRYQYLYNVNCNYTLTSSSSTNLRLDIVLPYSNVNHSDGTGSNMFAHNNVTCLFLNPDNSQLIIDSNNANADKIANEISNVGEDINNNLNDTSVSSDTNSNASAIFNLNIDTGHGLTSIIIAPLSFLEHAKTQCSSKSFVIFGKTITLPCGDSLFWAKDFSSYSSIFNSGLTGSGLNNARDSFRVFWNALFGGAIVFHLLLKLWEEINKALDPSVDSYQSLSSAIDTGSAVRDTDGDGPFNGYVPKHSKDHYVPKHGGGL